MDDRTVQRCTRSFGLGWVAYHRYYEVEKEVCNFRLVAVPYQPCSHHGW